MPYRIPDWSHSHCLVQDPAMEKLKTSAKVATCVLQEIVATQTLLIEARALYATM